jgi:single-strand DNA-binding protein
MEISMSNTVQITGNLGGDPELRFTPNGAAVASFTVADTPRRKNEQGQWEDAGETLWLRCSVWREKAEAVAEQLKRGDTVSVTGRLKQRSWEDKDGSKRTVIECDAFEVAKVVKPAPAQRAPQQSQGDPWAAQSAASASWGTPADSEPPF